MDDNDSIDVLNSLIIINNDRIDGYEAAYSETYKEELRDLFMELQQTSQKCKDELKKKVELLGGNPEKGTMLLGKFHRGWMDIKAAITGSDSTTILDSCEFGEKTIMKAYEDALRENMDEANNEQRIMLNNHYTLLKTDYEKVKAMKILIENEM